MFSINFLIYVIRFIRRYVVFLTILFLILLSTVIFYFYNKSTINKDPDIIAEGKALVLVETVGKLAFLPQNEIPTIAVVSDPLLLKDQLFFIDAKKGDMVLIYANKKKAVLYDPIANKIVNMSTINSSSKPKDLLLNSRENQASDSSSSGDSQF
ncbi:MAG: hypothetical protein AAB510_01950 [Patescibacteria group bacterium]